MGYFDCPVEFSHPVFRLASDIERSRIAHRVPLDENDIVVAIEADTMAGLEPKTFFLVAESWTVLSAM